MVRIARSLALGLATLPLAACATLMPSEQPVSVTGSVTYRERLALPPTAQVEIRIDDVSLADAPSRTVARQSFTADGRQLPFAFRLTVDRRPPHPRGSVAPAARTTAPTGPRT